MNSDEFTTWSTYDSIVQDYRANMLASQSLLLAVEAILFERSILLEIIICAIGLFQLWYIWFAIIRARTIISDFHKFNALYNFSKIININGDKSSEQNSLPLTEEKYVSDKTVRNRANYNLAEITKIPKLKTNFRITRLKLDVILPISFTIIWVILIVFQIV